MDLNFQEIKIIEESWDEEGFFYKLRYRIFDRELFNRVCTAISKLSFSETDIIERDLIRLLWFIPVFMTRQRDYVENIDQKEYDSLCEKIIDIIAGVLGYP